MKLQINITNKAMYSLGIFLVIIAMVSVYAYNSGKAPGVLGHSGEEISIVLNNIEYTLGNLMYLIDGRVTNLEARLNAPRDVKTSTTNTINGLTSGKLYLVSVYGITANRGNDGATLGAVKITNCATTPVNLVTTGTKSINWHDGQAPQSATFVITSPSDGCIKVATDNSVEYVVAVKLDS